MLHGHTTISSSQCASAYQAALRFISLSHQYLDTEEEEVPLPTVNEVKKLRDDLEKLLMLRQSLPVAVGSGKASLRHKLHALVHLEGMTSESWKSAAALLSSTFSFTGDLGTESHITECRVRLADLIGTWAVDVVDQHPCLVLLVYRDFVFSQNLKVHFYYSHVFLKRES